MMDASSSAGSRSLRVFEQRDDPLGAEELGELPRPLPRFRTRPELERAVGFSNPLRMELILLS